MRRSNLWRGAVLCGVLATLGAQAAIRVAVEQGPSATGTATSLAAQLNDDTWADFTATVVNSTQIDSAAELSNYDVVIFGDTGNNNNDWTPAMAAALKAAVNAGTLGVVSTGWADYAIHGAPEDLDLDEVMPIDAAPNSSNYYCGSGATITFTGGTHPITNGLTSFTLTTSADVEISPFAPDATNGVVLGTASASSCTSTVRNAVVAGQYGSGKIVYLGMLYNASSSYGPTDLRSGMPDRLLEQAVQWVAGSVAGAPVPTSQTVQAMEEVPVAINLGCVDPEGSPVTYAVASQPTKGVLSGTAPALTYTPNVNAIGADSFTFTCSDGTLTSFPGTVTINIANVNDPPTAMSQTITVPEDAPTPFVLTASDPDGDALTLTFTTQPSRGTVTGVPPNLTFLPNPNEFGADSFTYVVSDGTATATATVTVTITPTNDPPAAIAQQVSVDQGSTAIITLQGMDPDGDPLTFVIVQAPAQGTLTGLAPNVVYTPPDGFSGPDGFTFVVSDGFATSAETSVGVTVVNLPPTLDIAASTLMPAEGQLVEFTAVTSDPGGDAVTVSWSFGDGATATALATNHAYANKGTYEVVATATDGKASVTRNLTLSVANAPPVISKIDGPTSGNEGAKLTFVAVASDTLPEEPLTYQWSWGDGSSDSDGVSAQHAFGDNGTYTVTLTVSDSQGAKSTSQHLVTVGNVAPVAVPMPDQPAKTGVELRVQLLASDAAGPRDPLTWALVSGEGAVTPTGEFVWTPADEQTGRFTIIVSVSDDDSGSTQVPFNVDVAQGAVSAGGCGCAAGPTSSGAPLWLLGAFAAVAFVAARPRRRQAR